jgi:hypothetical protein
MGYPVYWEYMDAAKEKRFEEKQQSDFV